MEYPDNVLVCEVDAWPVTEVQQRNGVLPPVAGTLIMVVLGALAVFIGIYLTPIIMDAGEFTAGNSDSFKLTRTGGEIWAVFGPIVPYVLLGGVLALVLRLSQKKRIPSIIAFALSICTCLYHVYSPMLKGLGERHHAKGIAESPWGFALFYCAVGLIVMFFIVMASEIRQKARLTYPAVARKEPLIRPFYYVLMVVVLATIVWLLFSSPSFFSSSQ